MNRFVAALAIATGGGIALWAAVRYAKTDRIAFALVVTMLVGFVIGAVETFRRLQRAEERRAELASIQAQLTRGDRWAAEELRRRPDRR